MDDDEYTEYVMKEIAEEYAKCFPDEYTPSDNSGLRVDE